MKVMDACHILCGLILETWQGQLVDEERTHTHTQKCRDWLGWICSNRGHLLHSPKAQRAYYVQHKEELLASPYGRSLQESSLWLGCTHRGRVCVGQSFLHTHSAFTQEPGEDFATPVGLRLRRPWHGHANVNNSTHSGLHQLPRDAFATS